LTNSCCASVLDIASKAIEFARFQNDLEAEFLRNEARKREGELQNREKLLGEKMLEHVGEINELKHRVAILK
jgi:hypothetical protein